MLTNASIEVSVNEANHSGVGFRSCFSRGSIGVDGCIVGIARFLVIELSQGLVYNRGSLPITPFSGLFRTVMR